MSTEPEMVLTLGRTRVVPLAPRDAGEAAALPAKLEALGAAAAADGHGVLAPTHLVVKGGEVAGYLSLGGMPTVHVWLDSKRSHAGDSVRVLELGETILGERGVRQYGMLCRASSPFAAVMERLGYRRLGETVLYTKEIVR